MAELVHEHAGAQDGAVINHYLTGYLGAVANDAVAADNAVVSHVHVLHEEVVASHHCLALGGGTAVDGHVLAYAVVVTYLGCGILATELEVLGNAAYHGSRMDLVAVTYA